MVSMYTSATVALALNGIATEAGAIAQALGSNQGLGTTTRTPAGLRQIIRGVQRVGGTIVYASTTGSSKRQYNLVICLATHPCEAIENLYLDGRQVFWDTSSSYNQTVGGYNFGGNASGGTYTGQNGVHYNFGGLVFCAAFYGNQNSNPTVVGGSWVGPNNQAGFCSALQANDGTWSPNANGTPYLAGCTYVYLKIEADAGMFPQFPEIRFTVHGKNDIYDPRTGTRGYTSNWALHIADALTDPTWGLGDNTVNQAQLIAACNCSDEQVQTASALPAWQPETSYTAGQVFVAPSPVNGAWTVNTGYTSGSVWGSADTSNCTNTPGAAIYESRYALHWHYDTSTSPGDAIQQMMSAAQGRLSRVGGEWFIYPAYWQGPSFTFDQNSLTDAIQWTPRRSLADLVNRVTGTYVAPDLPYNVAGDLYDGNGYFNGQTQNNFPYSFQPTNFPMYAADALHGYGEDVYLIADTSNAGTYNSANTYTSGTVVIYNGTPWQATQSVPAGNAPSSTSAYWSATGNYLPFELQLPCVLSIAQAQRLAKIHMMRNRQQGSGTLTMSLAALQMQPLDVMQFNFSTLGWSNKTLEIATSAGDPCMRLFMKADASGTPALHVQVKVQETDPSVYEWDPAEELNAYDVPVISGGVNAYTVAVPTSLSALSDMATALVQPDGTVIPRIELNWVEPADVYVTNGGSIEIQMCAHGSGAWQDVQLVAGQTTNVYLSGVVSGNSYDVRIRAVRSNGAQSGWLELDNIVCGFAGAASNLTAVAPPGTLLAITTGSSSSIVVNPFTATYFNLTASVLGGDLPSLNPGSLYYVYYIDTAFAGGAVTFVATQNANDFLNHPGYFLVGSVRTPVATGGSVLAPTAFSDQGTAASSAPGVVVGDFTNPYGGPDYGTSTEAAITGYGNPLIPSSAFGQVVYSGWPSSTSAAGQNLYCIAAVTSTPGSGDPAPTSQWAITACLSGSSTHGAQPSGQLGTLNARGVWAASTAYALWDTFTEGGLTYLVVRDYTSGSSFGSADITNSCVVLASGSGGSMSTTVLQVAIPTGTNLATVSVNITCNAVTTGGSVTVLIGNGTEPSIYIE